MEIVFFEVEKWEANLLLELYGDVDYTSVPEPLTAASAAKYADAEIISTFIYSELGRETLSQLKNLKMITTRSRTYDHIDMEYCNAHGIYVTNVPSYGEHTVAEHVFALLLAISRHIPEATRRTREGKFSSIGLQGFDLRGQTLGVIGTGEIGIEVIRIAKAFGMQVLACDLMPQMELCKELYFTYTSFDRLIAQSDIITLHVGGGDIRHLISTPQVEHMKNGVVIINTARGDVIDAKALLAGLHSGKVAAAGLDVLPEEPAVKEEAQLLRPQFGKKYDIEAVLADKALLQHENVLVTPHTAYYTRETVRDVLCVTGNNINAYLNKKPFRRVNGPKFSPPDDRK